MKRCPSCKIVYFDDAPCTSCDVETVELVLATERDQWKTRYEEMRTDRDQDRDENLRQWLEWIEERDMWRARADDAEAKLACMGEHCTALEDLAGDSNLNQVRAELLAEALREACALVNKWTTRLIDGCGPWFVPAGTPNTAEQDAEYDRDEARVAELLAIAEEKP